MDNKKSSYVRKIEVQMSILEILCEKRRSSMTSNEPSWVFFIGQMILVIPQKDDFHNDQSKFKGLGRIDPCIALSKGKCKNFSYFVLLKFCIYSCLLASLGPLNSEFANFIKCGKYKISVFFAGVKQGQYMGQSSLAGLRRMSDFSRCK